MVEKWLTRRERKAGLGVSPKAKVWKALDNFLVAARGKAKRLLGGNGMRVTLELGLITAFLLAGLAGAALFLSVPPKPGDFCSGYAICQ